MSASTGWFLAKESVMRSGFSFSNSVAQADGARVKTCCGYKDRLIVPPGEKQTALWRAASRVIRTKEKQGEQ
jgi:hypothetical protein